MLRRKRMRIPAIRRIYADLFNIINMRRSERKFLSKEVDEGKLDAIFEAARWAPSWQNKQCWHFLVVKDKEKIKAIAKYSTIINSWIANAPAVIIACGDPSLSGVRDDLQYFLVDVAIATTHFVLAAQALGFGTCWVGVFDEDMIKEIFDIPENIRIVALIPIGYPTPKKNKSFNLREVILNANRRKWTDDFVHWEKW